MILLIILPFFSFEQTSEFKTEENFISFCKQNQNQYNNICIEQNNDQIGKRKKKYIKVEENSCGPNANYIIENDILIISGS